MNDHVETIMWEGPYPKLGATGQNITKRLKYMREATNSAESLGQCFTSHSKSSLM